MDLISSAMTKSSLLKVEQAFEDRINAHGNASYFPFPKITAQ